MEILINKIEQLIYLLKSKKNKTSDFFEIILEELKNDETRKDAIKKILGCYAITQYANYGSQEENLLDEVWEQAKILE